jgi:hypothetical protein
MNRKPNHLRTNGRWLLHPTKLDKRSMNFTTKNEDFFVIESYLADVIFVALNGVGVLTILGWADERLSCIGGKVKTGKNKEMMN